jgi:hypothetical protein
MTANPDDKIFSVELRDRGKFRTSSRTSHSRLGIWYLEGKPIERLAAQAEASVLTVPFEDLEAFSGTRTAASNLYKVVTVFKDVSDPKTSDLLSASFQVAQLTSTFLEQVTKCPKPGLLSDCHVNGDHIVARVLNYQSGGDAPSHADGSGYTLLFNTATLQVLDPMTHEWIDVEPPCAGKQCLLIMGRYFSSPTSIKLHAPVHRVGPAGTSGRKALAICVNADRSWPSVIVDDKVSRKGNTRQIAPLPTTSDLLVKDSVEGAENFSKDFLEKHVPSTSAIRDHWDLLQIIVNGPEPSSPHRPASIDCEGYWQIQINRYMTFLDMHKSFPTEAAGILPPRILHHVWICHQLQPKCYRDDCMAILDGRVLPHNNGSFNVDGCESFHALWKKHAGSEWPSADEIAREVQNATDVPKPEKDLAKERCIGAIFWKGLDGLEAIMDSVQVDCSIMFSSDSELEETRANYARYVAAAAYVPSMSMAPGSAMDLVWHAHQTDPLSYQAAMDDLPRFLDHCPCGKLNPPQAEWVTATQSVWLQLYGTGVDLPGQSIECCCESTFTPIHTCAPRPPQKIKRERPKGVFETSIRIRGFQNENRSQTNDGREPAACWYTTVQVYPHCSTLATDHAPRTIELGLKNFPFQQLKNYLGIKRLAQEELRELDRLLVSLRDAVEEVDVTSHISSRRRLDNFLCCLTYLTMGTVGVLVKIVWPPSDPFLEQRRVLATFSDRLRGFGLEVSLSAVPTPPRQGYDPYSGPALCFTYVMVP